MFQSIGTVRLKTGESVEAGVVIGPDLDWAERIEKLLDHKGDPWNWQNSQMLRSKHGIDARFYVLHRAGVPFANIATFELSGVGLFGHVWTVPEDRQKGASSRLMGIQMGDFRARGGKALFLGTEYGSVAYRMYRKFGFHGVEAQSGYMAWYAISQRTFDGAYFAASPAEIQALQWSHWPSSEALFLGDHACVVRSAPLRLIGRHSVEAALLGPLQDAEARLATNKPPRFQALCSCETTAVVGLAGWGWHPLWEGVCLVDVFCHPDHWHAGQDLLMSLSLPEARRYIAYADAGCDRKREVLLEAGFEQTMVLKDRVAESRAQSSFRDVAVYERR
jgi:hypothetical protein